MSKEIKINGVSFENVSGSRERAEIVGRFQSARNQGYTDLFDVYSNVSKNKYVPFKRWAEFFRGGEMYISTVSRWMFTLAGEKDGNIYLITKDHYKVVLA